MAKQGFYGKEYVRAKGGDYDYQGQVNRLHNLVQWDKKSAPIAPANATVSLDELNERYKAYDWLVADDKHWEAQVIKHADAYYAKKRKAYFRKQALKRKVAATKELDYSFISRIAKGGF